MANGGFEDINVCTEYKATCEPEAWYFIPSYIVEPQGNDSNKYEILSVGSLVHGPRGGNYLYTKLLCPLIKGHRYAFSIWVATPKNKFDHLDVWLGENQPLKYRTALSVTDPAFTLRPAHVVNSKPRWKQYRYAFRATGNESFIMLGSFSDVPIDKAQIVANNKSGDILYAIDNVELVPLDKESRCKQYYGVVQQLYDQNYRHPAKPLDKIPIDSSLTSFDKNRGLDSLGSRKGKDSIYKVLDTLIIPDILFNYNSSQLNRRFIKSLDSIVSIITVKGFKKIEVLGHTDNIGTEKFNNELSLNRANTIRNYILSKTSASENLVEATGLGERKPVATNKTESGRRRNRRVEIILKK